MTATGMIITIMIGGVVIIEHLMHSGAATMVHLAKKLAFCIGALSALFFAPQPVSALDSITWMKVNMPPFRIQDGPESNQGYGDIAETLLQQHLPEYRHEVMATNVVRHFNRFKKGEKVCSIGLYRTPERDTFLQFSIPSLLTLPPGLIILKNRLAELGLKEPVSLDDLLSHNGITIAFSRDRSYGVDIDAILKRHSTRVNSIVFSGQELTENFFQMLVKKRVDALIGLPDEAMYKAEKMGLRDQIATVGLEENWNNYAVWFCAVGCTKNEWGKRVIEKINAILIQQRPSEHYRAAYERWLDTNALARYRTVYDDVFLATRP